MEKKDSEGF